MTDSRPQLPGGVGVGEAGLRGVRPCGDDFPCPLELFPEVLDGHLDALYDRQTDQENQPKNRTNKKQKQPQTKNKERIRGIVSAFRLRSE